MELFKIIYIVAITQLLFLSVILLVKKQTAANMSLAMFMLLKALVLLFPLLNRFYLHDFFQAHKLIPVIWQPVNLLLAPMVYLAIAYATTQKARFYKPDAFMFILPLAVPLFYILCTLFIPNSAVVENLNIIVRYIFYCQFFVYMFLSYRLIRTYKQHVRNYSSNLAHTRIFWVELVYYNVLFFWTINFILFLSRRYHLPPWVSIGFELSFLIGIVVWVIRIFDHEFLKLPLTIQDAKYTTSKLSEADKTLILQTVKALMVDQQLYFEPDLTIDEVACKAGFSSRNISQVVNEKLNQNFYEFVNHYRIKESIRLLSDPKQYSKTIMEVLFESGFSSKSSFYQFFKKQTGMTPIEFRKKCMFSSQMN